VKDLYNLKVAAVQDEFRIVINAGAEDNVREDMTFVIFDEGDEIIDPETGNSLGRVETVKGRVEVIHVQSKMSIARSSEFTEQKHAVSRTIFEPFSSMGGAERPYDIRQVRKRLNNVNIGDHVRRIS
jgi:hypothetical protein